MLIEQARVNDVADFILSPVTSALFQDAAPPKTFLVKKKRINRVSSSVRLQRREVD